jgi:hypothetical protein
MRYEFGHICRHMKLHSGRHTYLKVRIEDYIKVQARQIARAHGRDISQHVRELIREDIARAGLKLPPPAPIGTFPAGAPVLPEVEVAAVRPVEPTNLQDSSVAERVAHNDQAGCSIHPPASNSTEAAA